MSRKLILFAERAEADATLRLLNAKQVDKDTFTFDQGWIALSRIGIHPAQMCVAKYAAHVDEVWNLGLAGALNEHHPVGALLSIQTVGKYVPAGKLDARSEELLPPHITLDKKGKRLISSDFPIHDHSHREQLSQKWDVVDMEGYGVAYAAHYLGKKCLIWKIISDFASPGGRELIRKNKVKSSEILAETIYEAIHESCPHSSFRGS